ncbi:MAG TPA: hypothetical protein VLT86_08715 [Vicinamibacterales bacterium]|nr:hypothetical protein [Vicinamibacterales bacterium]
MDIRRSSAASANPAIKRVTPKRGQGNAKWLAARAQPGAVVLLGGAGLDHFRLRVAQSHLRHDLLPSFWSLAGIVASSTSFLTVPITIRDASAVPATNGVETVRFAQVDDPEVFPNAAVLQFASPAGAIVANVRRLMRQRSALDLPTLMLPWLGFIWSAGTRRNPLIEGGAMPSAALVQTAFGMAGIELTPGLASGSNCPEAVWQSALWWHDYYQKTADVSGARVATDTSATKAPSKDRPKPIVPAGEACIRQAAAAVTHEER